MAAASTLQYNRQKKSVYGKASKSTWSATNFFDNSDDELAGPTTAAPVKGGTQRSTSVKSVYPVQKAEVKRVSPAKGTKAKKDKQDTFDIPSSDEEHSPPARVVRKPLFQSKRPLVDDTVDAAGSLPSWKHKRARITPPGNNTSRRRDVQESAKQLSSDLARAVSTVDKSREPSMPADATQKPVSPSPGKASGAAARLAVRKRVAQNHGQSDPAATTCEKNASSTTPHKRARTSEPPSQDSEDVVMTDDAPLPSCDNGLDWQRNADQDRDIYDFPASSADESAKPPQANRSPKVVKKLSRRTKPAAQKAQTAAAKGVSAPARLAEMLPTDSEATEPSTASHSETASRASTPRHPSTPPFNKMCSPGATVRRQGTLTPKQAQLWDRLLPTQPAAPSPSGLAMKDLTISGRNMRAAGRSGKASRMTSSQPEMPKSRTRLVDRLKASAESSSEDEVSDSSSESESEDVERGSNAAQSKPSLLRPESTQSRMNVTSNSQSQSRSQHAVSTTTGFKRTYASQRSYLAEDNLEDDIMAGILDDTPKQAAAKPKAYGRSASNTKKDAFDIDDSDDDAAAGGGIRSVHELRAAGRHIRGAEDIEQLLEDVENHSASHKSRRRSALMDIATKLSSKTFASRFIGQGCDLRLAKQWRSPQDDVASFLLATSVVMMLASDPPEHTVRTLQDSNAMPWLATLLTATKEVSKMARERQYNMAKASQASLLQLTDLVRSHTLMWSDGSPSSLSTKLVALKGLDMLAGKLRRAGDKSELLEVDQLPLVLPQGPTPGVDAELETSLGVSILESLSTTSLALTWDPELLQRISQTLVSSNTQTPPRRHTFFLTLRLTLNLTTDNPRNADLLATAPSVPHLLQTVLSGFHTLDSSAHKDNEDETRTLALDILVLALGICINIFEHSAIARAHAAANPADIDALVATFVAGQHRLADAEDLAASTSNVALGYLAVALANLCQSPPARALVCGTLPGGSLELLGDSVEEFVRFHAQVDGLAGAGPGADVSFAGEEGREVWGGFTERLRGVLERVRGMQEGGEAAAG